VAHVLVIGASGGIGRETLSAALDAGHRVRAFSRSANEIDLENSYLKKHSQIRKFVLRVDAYSYRRNATS
jgi:NAD(P)-dependent dehydrogenase (short-subunit alcohol dehydrogenase family)